MSGNVWEYVGDWQGKGDKRIFCGGGWSGFIPGGDPLCSGNNTIQKNDSRRQDVGFRLAHPPINKAQAAAANSSAPASSTFTDSRDNKTYKQVKIGNQTWMAENLNYNANGSKCYDNKPANCDKYGRLYNWNTAKTACPAGWHLPSDAEWTTLAKTAGGTGAYGDEGNAGTKLRAKSGWDTGKGYKAGTDNYGFSALPGGYDNLNGFFADVGSHGYWWSATEEGGNSPCAYCRFANYESVHRECSGKSHLQSVRCVKN